MTVGNHGWLPLGEYEQFSQSTPLPWGGSSGWTITYGQQVIPDLVDGILAHTEVVKGYSRKHWPASAALGCVPYFTNTDVADALMQLDSCCVVVDKQASHSATIANVMRTQKSLSTFHFHELAYTAVPAEDGAGPPTIGPGSPEPDPIELGPIRLAGWQRDQLGKPRPMLHAKMLLLGVTMIGEGEYGEEVPTFVPHRTWVGSANWTTAAKGHLEYGIWCDDHRLMRHNRKFLIEVIRFSEPWDSAAVGPEPQIVDLVWDDDAFAEYFQDIGPPEDDDD